MALWSTPLLTPARLLVVVLHELGHALAATLSGGEVVFIELTENEGGLTAWRGGAPVFVLLAGYPSPLIAGALLGWLAVKARSGPLAVALRGVGAVPLVLGALDLGLDALAADPQGDAARLAALTGWPAWGWSGLWGAVAVALLAACGRSSGSPSPGRRPAPLKLGS